MEYLHIFDHCMMASEIEREIAVHDYCVNTFEYDYSFGDYSFSVLGPILDKKAACEGISKFVKLALDYLKVENIVVFGKAIDPVNGSKPERHAWNIVYVDGSPYHLDVTFDMTIKKRINRYDYFNLSDDDIKREHTIINTLPTCSAQGNDYYSKKEMTVNSPTELSNYIANCLKRGERDIVIKLRNVKDRENVVDKVLDIARQQHNEINMYRKNTAINITYNPSQLVFELNFR